MGNDGNNMEIFKESIDSVDTIQEDIMLSKVRC
jgi:hypothetical protein